MEDRSKRAETVRPQHDKHCKCQFVCDSVLSAKCEVNDIELNGETDDENMEDGETAFDDVSAQDEYRKHITTHRPCRSWCKFCVMGRGVNSPHRRSDAQEDLEGVGRCWFQERELNLLGLRREQRSSLISLGTTE